MFYERLKALCKEKSTTVTALLSTLNMSPAQGTWWKKGSSPKYETLVILARHFNVSVDYLMGKDDSLSTSEPQNAYDVAPQSFCKLPIVGTISAGYDGVAREEIVGYAYADVPCPSSYIYLLVKGDSMYPDIKQGDLALIEKTPIVPNGSIAAVIYNGDEATLKKVKKEGSTLILSPLNPEYEPLVFHGDELKSVKFVGKMVEIKRVYK